MDAAVTVPKPKRVRIKRILPYLAVFEADLRHTMHSWLYRAWVTLSVLVSGGYVLYRFGAYSEFGVIHPAARLVSDLMNWLVLGSMTLIIILTAGTISAERGTMADAVLSRGISRIQYYLGKWHSRLLCVLGTYFLLGALLIAVCIFLLRDTQLTVLGSAIALCHVAGLIAVVISCAVAVSAICNNTLLGVAIIWMLLYGTSFALMFLPPMFPAPDRLLRNLPNVLCGYYDLKATYYLLGWCAGASLFMSLVGLLYFSRRDV